MYCVDSTLLIHWRQKGLAAPWLCDIKENSHFSGPKSWQCFHCLHKYMSNILELWVPKGPQAHHRKPKMVFFVLSVRFTKGCMHGCWCRFVKTFPIGKSSLEYGLLVKTTSILCALESPGVWQVFLDVTQSCFRFLALSAIIDQRHRWRKWTRVIRKSQWTASFFSETALICWSCSRLPQLSSTTWLTKSDTGSQLSWFLVLCFLLLVSSWTTIFLSDDNKVNTSVESEI